MISLANKYRSQTFDDLIGQDHISHILKYQAAQHTRQANYLFFWPRGTGKTSSARLFAKAINCLNIETTGWNPCNVCENCIAINNGTTVDIMEIDAASHTWVDNIREEVIDKIVYRPTQLKKRITIIDEVHMLSKGAFNALLKTMEEPTERMVFILATTELNKVPDTIISRCQLFNFKKIPSWQIIDRLDYIAWIESITTNNGWLAMIADLSDGCMRDAVKYLDQISVMGDVNESTVAQFLWVVSEASVGQFTILYDNYQWSWKQDDFANLMNFVEELGAQGVDLTNFPKQLAHYADRHFAENMKLFSTISALSADLLRQAKWFPHPLLLYKTLIFQSGATSSWGENKGDNKISIKKDEEIAKKSQSISQDSSMNSKEITAKSEKSETKDEKIEVTSKSETPWNTESSDPLDVVRSQAITQLPPSLQNLLSEQSELTKIHEGVVTLIVTNAMGKLSLKQKKNQDIILSTLSTLIEKNCTHLDIIIMTKEEYFQHQMKN